MSLNDLMQTGGGILLIASVLVQIAPIEVNPWSFIARHVGRALNKELVDRIDENDAKNARYRIIRFNDEVRHNEKHTEEHFDQILDDIDTYEKYCKMHPLFPNGKALHSVSNIKKIYEKCCEENSFL